MSRVLGAVVCMIVLLPVSPGAAVELDPAPLELVDVPATVPAGSLASVAAFVPRGSTCRLLLKQRGASRWRGPRAKAKSTFMQFPWTQPVEAPAGIWRLRVKCRTDLARRKSPWARFEVVGAGTSTAASPTLSRPASASLSAVPASYGWQPFGATLIRGTEWFGGRGVDVRSNGGNGCAAGCAVRGPYGTKYQCVELVNRFVRTQGWVSENIWGNAGQMLDKAPSEAFAKHPVGDGYVPVPGDVIVWSGGSSGYGHVAVVSAVDAKNVTFVEQNASKTGSYRLKHLKGKLSAYGSLRHLGYLHAHANSAPSGG